MFFSGERIWTLLEFVLADDRAARAKALSRLLALHRSDFEVVLEEMKGRPVAVRLLDPPLQAFMALLRLPLEGAANGWDCRRYRGSAPQDLAGDESGAGPERLRLGIHYPDNMRVADPGVDRSGLQPREERRQDAAGNHGALCRLRVGICRLRSDRPRGIRADCP
jgi:hypothetical protein